MLQGILSRRRTQRRLRASHSGAAEHCLIPLRPSFHQLNKQGLIYRIERAWADAKYPGDQRIFTPDSYDDEGITEYFAGTTWKGHSIANLRAHSTAISTFFTPSAYRYWLPAYLIAAVEDPDELSQGVDSIVVSLTPAADGAQYSEEQEE